MPLLNNNNGYQSDSRHGSMRKPGLPPKIKSGLTPQHQNTQPVRGVHPGGGVEPDNRYYTKANFFSLRQNSRDGTAISEKY